MKTVRDACTLQDNALSIKVSDQIEQLDELIKEEGNGQAFFEKTFITQGMRDLLTEGVARLAGASTQSVFHLKQAMGGGKTHILVGFGLIARDPELRKKYCAGIAYINSFEKASVVAFNGRNNPEHYLWGEVASQLGKGEQFKSFWDGGPKAPDENDWLKLFNGPLPILILLDELPPYFKYLDVQKSGNGTIADIATRAFANMLSAAGKKKNVCIVVSDLTAAYDTGSQLINRALKDACSELGRQERNITPVDLAANEIYDILRKRLFKQLPEISEIGDIAENYGRKLEEATKSKTVQRGAESIADEIVSTYPFHPRLKNVIALFKENEQFKQTRGLIELVSRLIKSVWERSSNDVFLIGPQHFDLSISEVRDKLTEFSNMRDVIAKDIWDSKISSHAQIIDLETGKETAAQIGSLLLAASLSTSVNAVKGLTREEMIECLISPLREPSEFLAAFEKLEKIAWYIHHTPEGRYYFDRQENLTKLLESYANDAPENQIDELISKRLIEMFKPTRNTCYEVVLPLPKLEEISDCVRKSRTLLIVSPDSKIPPEKVQKFFDGLSKKNNICVLTGDKTAMGSIEKAARQFYAANKADQKIPKTHPQREDLEKRQQTYEQDFNSTILNLFDKVIYPRQKQGSKASLAPKSLDSSRDTSKPYSGEEQIEKTLTTDPLKLYLDIEKDFDAILDKAQDLLWGQNNDEASWSDIMDRYTEQAGMPWLPPKGLEKLKLIAINREIWEELDNGYITKKPKKKCTSAQIIPETEPDDNGCVRLTVNPLNAGPAPKIYYAEDEIVTVNSSVLKENQLKTKALCVNFLVCDTSKQYETGNPVTWVNKLKISNNLSEKDGCRKIELFVVPRGDIFYTLDGSEPSNGIKYSEPIEISDESTLLRVFASADVINAKTSFNFLEKGEKDIQVDKVKPAKLAPNKNFKLDSRGKVFDGLKYAKDFSANFENIIITVGQGEKMISITIGEVQVEADFIKGLLNEVISKFQPETPVTMSFRKASFTSGHDLMEFAKKLGIELIIGDVVQ